MDDPVRILFVEDTADDVEMECACRNGQVVAVVTVNLDAFRLVEEGFGRGVSTSVGTPRIGDRSPP
jgi:proline racemase